MASEKIGNVLGAFFDEGASTPLFGTGEGSVVAAYGMVGGQPAYAVCQTGAAVSAKDIDKMAGTAKLAAKTGNPLVTFYNAPGVKLEDGLAAMKATSRLNAKCAKISGVVPQIAVVTGVCGASSAMAAANADICIVTKDAELFLSSPFLSAAAGDAVEGAASAGFAVKAGVATMVVDDAEAAAREAAKLVMLLPGNNLSAPASFEYAPPAAQLAKYSAEAAIAAVADDGSAVELYEGFGSSLRTALATVNGSVVGIVATEGPDAAIGNCGITRAARFVRLCDAYSVPLVTVINTAGFKQSASEDAAGAIRGAARLAATYADATTAKVAVLAGKVVGTSYAALASADLTVAMEGATIAPVDPAAAVTVLYREEINAAEGSLEAETATRAAAYAKDVASASAALAAGIADFVATPATLRSNVASALDILASKRVQRIAKKHGNMAL